MKKSIILFFLIFFLNGCSFFSPVSVDQVNQYVINPYQSHHIINGKKGSVIYVAVPEVNPLFNTEQIAYTTKPFQIAYYAKNTWAETPSQMLLPLIVKSLQSTGHYRAVLSPPLLSQYYYILQTQLTVLQFDFSRRLPRVELSMHAQLLHAGSNILIASGDFHIYEPIRAITPYEGVIATNRATARLLNQLAQFCINHT